MSECQCSWCVKLSPMLRRLRETMSPDDFTVLDEVVLDNMMHETDYAHEEMKRKEAETMVGHLKELIKLKDEYIKLSIEEYDSMAGIAVAHGWKSKLVEEGNALRAKIRKLEITIYENEKIF